MSISFKKYVNIVSGVGGGAGVRQRDLIGRIITSNVLVSPDAVLEFTSADDVITFFGAGSEEANRAVAYFGYVSPSIATPRKISFSRWSEAGNGAAVIGNADPKVLSSLTPVTAGTFSIALNGAAPVVIGPVNLSGAGTVAAAAALVQTAVQAAGGAFAAATVAYGSVGASRFSIQFPPAQLGSIRAASVTVGAQDIGLKLGITVAADALNIAGVAAQQPVDAIQAASDITNNYASFLFIDDLSNDEATAVAAYNKALNVFSIFCFRDDAATAAATAALLATYGGTALTLDPNLTGEFPDQIPMTILAATDYNKRNSVQNYMFKQFAGITPSVQKTTDSDAWDAIRVNYYGETQTAGQKIDFYQRGTLMGLATDPSDMNVYANEIWLKDYVGSQIMSLQLSISRIPANDTGVGLISNIIQPVIDAALFNGSISVGKVLTPVQKAFIAQQTGNDLAWHAVQDVGYILSVIIEPYVTVSGATEYKAVYTLIYSKDDAIRLVEGTHELI